jgi:hypothetical protein
VVELLIFSLRIMDDGGRTVRAKVTVEYEYVPAKAVISGRLAG